ncbi:unnamed protein product [Prorocentrum cordatum]|nr:unnamed protein product [Polarella glacialis]
MYFAVLSLASVGYGDTLVTPGEHSLNSFFLLLGQLYAAKICADLTWLTATYNFSEAQYQARRAQMWIALQKMQVPSQLAGRVLAYQSYVAASTREDLSQAAFVGLSGNLKEELRIVAYRLLVCQAPFLRMQSKEVLSLIVSQLTDKVYLPLDVIMRTGDVGRELFFMRRGKAGVFNKLECLNSAGNPLLTVYSVGNYFGELGMLTGNPRSAWVVASTYCVCSVLPYEAVEILTQEVPGAFTVLVQSIVSRYKLKPSVTWSDISRRILAKFDVDDLEDAYEKFCALDGAGDEELSARNFDEALRRLKVPELDRKILWADMDEDNSGFVSQDEFTSKLITETARCDGSPDASRATSKATFDSFAWTARSNVPPDADRSDALSRRARMRQGTKEGQLRFQRSGSRHGTRRGTRHGTWSRSSRRHETGGREPMPRTAGNPEAARAFDAAGAQEQASRFLMELVLEAPCTLSGNGSGGREKTHFGSPQPGVPTHAHAGARSPIAHPLPFNMPCRGSSFHRLCKGGGARGFPRLPKVGRRRWVERSRRITDASSMPRNAQHGSCSSRRRPCIGGAVRLFDTVYSRLI